MFLVLLSNVQTATEARRAQTFRVQFRTSEMAETFARNMTCFLVLHVSCRWELAIYVQGLKLFWHSARGAPVGEHWKLYRRRGD